MTLEEVGKLWLTAGDFKALCNDAAVSGIERLIANATKSIAFSGTDNNRCPSGT